MFVKSETWLCLLCVRLAERYSCASSPGGVVWEPLLSPAHTSGVAGCLSAVLPSDGELGVEAEILAHVITKDTSFQTPV